MSCCSSAEASPPPGPYCTTGGDAFVYRTQVRGVLDTLQGYLEGPLDQATADTGPDEGLGRFQVVMQTLRGLSLGAKKYMLPSHAFRDTGSIFSQGPMAIFLDA